ncbi:MAG TPA: phosphatase PAP2 family protein [Ruminiclostridium sp.]
MKKSIDHNQFEGPQNAAQKAVKEETSSPGVRRAKAILFQLSVGIMIGAFGILTFLVVTIPTFSIDLAISKWVQGINNPFFSWLMTSLSWVGFPPQSFIVTVIIIVLIYVLGYHWEAVSSIIASTIVELLNQLIKTLVRRARPSASLIHVTNLLNSYSFPSGHVMFYTGFFGFICFLIFTLLKPSWKRTLLLLAFGSHVVLIGLSRIYLGEHWASDVVGAYLLGGLCLIGFIHLYRWGKPKFFVRQPLAKDNK